MKLFLKEEIISLEILVIRSLTRPLQHSWSDHQQRGQTHPRQTDMATYQYIPKQRVYTMSSCIYQAMGMVPHGPRQTKRTWWSKVVKWFPCGSRLVKGT